MATGQSDCRKFPDIPIVFIAIYTRFPSLITSTATISSLQETIIQRIVRSFEAANENELSKVIMKHAWHKRLSFQLYGHPASHELNTSHYVHAPLNS
ncbi:hypothetical protein RRF57_005574 [Xylaria bambusicola]|uniref:Uncharacterized protein n=1 Tax=Xylaria bambusicola TaxID=326684 RepID=A0AAN7Z859_9PEZI